MRPEKIEKTLKDSYETFFLGNHKHMNQLEHFFKISESRTLTQIINLVKSEDVPIYLETDNGVKQV